MTSLSATILRQRITSALQSKTSTAGRSLAQNAIYTYPTMNALAQHIVGLLFNPCANEQSIADIHIEAMEEMIRRYEFPAREETAHRSHRPTNYQGRTVLLTGSTGHLGSQILDGLLRDPSISKVYTINRPVASQSIADRHRERFRDKGLEEGLLESSKIVYLETEYSKAQLGLSNELYSEVCRSLSACYLVSPFLVE
jgi:FlaA1/EpsC-like NDP-sugar epimerase